MPLLKKPNENTRKITDYTSKHNKIDNIATDKDLPSTSCQSQKRLLSLPQPVSHKKLRFNSTDIMEQDKEMASTSQEEKTPADVMLQNALGPLLQEFKSLQESVKSDYEDLKHTITKQKDELQQELVNKIDNNTQQITSISHENKLL